jgi:hypothetical protein
MARAEMKVNTSDFHHRPLLGLRADVALTASSSRRSSSVVPAVGENQDHARGDEDERDLRVWREHETHERYDEDRERRCVQPL